jgi:hypothetical protein
MQILNSLHYILKDMTFGNCVHGLAIQVFASHIFINLMIIK